MTLEAILAYCHLLAILTMVIIASEAALCRVHWLNAAVVERLVLIDTAYGIAALAVLATGVLVPGGASRAQPGIGPIRCRM